MKKLSKSILLCLSFQLLALCVSYAYRATFFSNSGLRFYIILDGNKMNNKPANRIDLLDLRAGMNYQLRILYETTDENQPVKDLNTNFRLSPYFDVYEYSVNDTDRQITLMSCSLYRGISDTFWEMSNGENIEIVRIDSELEYPDKSTVSLVFLNKKTGEEKFAVQAFFPKPEQDSLRSGLYLDVQQSGKGFFDFLEPWWEGFDCEKYLYTRDMYFYRLNADEFESVLKVYCTNGLKRQFISKLKIRLSKSDYKLPESR